ncbi:putative MPP superfamily phosphohydrolase [Trueperella bonasi]|uniref:MPP superfamily phosphohydrolase n=1 Tax=Trueperella bonasi TaxID=312286 RepID=A0ABT9NFU1_9ACTO|nr:metallophosphoesterase [Trueperella bonasi]MDP9806261.1 putative MPP superfamily phosphohydrolase [Trueperella bonasi]
MKRKLLLGFGVTVLGAGAAGLAYGLVHAHSYRLRRRSVLTPGDVAPVRVLHISDTHALARHSKRIDFLRALGDTKPDLVVVTGDILAEDQAREPVLDALGPLLDLPGVFVFGSNDYYAPVFKNPFRYLLGPSNRGLNGKASKHNERLDWRELRSALTRRGWVDLNNGRARLEVAGWTLDFVGVDDPHIHYNRFPEKQTWEEPEGPHVRIGVTHAPYTGILDEMVADGCSMIFAGHTHGGQICLPGGRALVSNCDLDPALASGLFPWPMEENSDAGEPVHITGDGAVIVKDKPGSAWVQVSAGIGTATYMPLRTFCPPEAILIDVVPVGGAS